MGFLDNNRIIENGDLTIVWVSRSEVYAVQMETDKVLNTRFGSFKHNDIIGQEFGSQVASSRSGFVHVLRPTPELWALSLPHRTQIVYSPDASYIIHRLRIRPGSVVIEAGTGSGALTHALARRVAKLGNIYTYEYHLDRFEQARAEFESHGLTNVHITHRNVCIEGFAQDNMPKATSVFLDLPSPWLAVPHLDGLLDRTCESRICCFSPCIEQVTRTIEALQRGGFGNIEMVEVQARKWEGHQMMQRTLDEAMDVLRDVRRRRQEGMDRRHGRIDEDAQRPDAYNPWGKKQRVMEGDPGFKWQEVSWMEAEVKSHTSYLTFAILAPKVPKRKSPE